MSAFACCTAFPYLEGRGGTLNRGRGCVSEHTQERRVQGEEGSGCFSALISTLRPGHRQAAGAASLRRTCVLSLSLSHFFVAVLRRTYNFVRSLYVVVVFYKQKEICNFLVCIASCKPKGAGTRQTDLFKSIQSCIALWNRIKSQSQTLGNITTVLLPDLL